MRADLTQTVITKVPESVKPLRIADLPGSKGLHQWMHEAQIERLGDLEGKVLEQLPATNLGQVAQAEMQRLLKQYGCEITGRVPAEAVPTPQASPYALARTPRTKLSGNFAGWVDEFVDGLTAQERKTLLDYYGTKGKPGLTLMEVAAAEGVCYQAIGLRLARIAQAFQDHYGWQLATLCQNLSDLDRNLQWTDIHEKGKPAHYDEGLYFGLLYRLRPELKETRQQRAQKRLDTFKSQYSSELNQLYIYVNRNVGKCTLADCVQVFQKAARTSKKETLAELDAFLRSGADYRIAPFQDQQYVFPLRFHWLAVMELILDSSPTPKSMKKLQELGAEFAKHYAVQNPKVPALRGLFSNSEQIHFFGPSIYGTTKHIRLKPKHWPAVTREFVAFATGRKRVTSTRDFLAEHPDWGAQLTHQELTAILKQSDQLSYVRKGNFCLKGAEHRVKGVKELLDECLNLQSNRPCSERELVQHVKQQRSFFGQQVGLLLGQMDHVHAYGYGLYGLAVKSPAVVRQMICLEDFYRNYIMGTDSLVSLDEVCKKLKFPCNEALIADLEQTSKNWTHIVCVPSKTLDFFRKNTAPRKLWKAVTRKYSRELTEEALEERIATYMAAAGRDVTHPARAVNRAVTQIAGQLTGHLKELDAIATSVGELKPAPLPPVAAAAEKLIGLAQGTETATDLRKALENLRPGMRLEVTYELKTPFSSCLARKARELGKEFTFKPLRKGVYEVVGK